MAEKTYAEKLKDPRWQKRRLTVMNRDKWACVYCGDKEITLAVHHKKYTGEPWMAPDNDLITVCEHCHQEIENPELKKLFSGKDIRVLKFTSDKNKSRLMIIMTEGILTMSNYDNSGLLVNGCKLLEPQINLLKSFLK